MLMLGFFKGRTPPRNCFLFTSSLLADRSSTPSAYGTQHSPGIQSLVSGVQKSRLASQFYLKNTAGAPVVEYSREAFENPEALVHGRVYWNTDFGIYHGPKYDTVPFGLWYDKLVRWLRRNGTRVEVTKGWYQYWLPGAWQLRNSSAGS